jgi:oxygen-independent coproporphyrinogen-3 oxidase
LDDYQYPLNIAKSLNDDDKIRQWVINKLMCALSLNFCEFKNTFGIEFSKYFAEELLTITEFVDEKFLEITDENIAVLAQGALFIRNICSLFDAYYPQGKKLFSKAI